MRLSTSLYKQILENLYKTPKIRPPKESTISDLSKAMRRIVLNQKLLKGGSAMLPTLIIKEAMRSVAMDYMIRRERQRMQDVLRSGKTIKSTPNLRVAIKTHPAFAKSTTSTVTKPKSITRITQTSVAKPKSSSKTMRTTSSKPDILSKLRQLQNEYADILAARIAEKALPRKLRISPEFWPILR